MNFMLAVTMAVQTVLRRIQDPTSDIGGELGRTFVSAVLVDKYRQAGDPDDTAAWQRAVAAAIAGGNKHVLAQSTSYSCSGRVDLAGANGLVISGMGMDATTITVNGTSTAVDSFFYNTGAFSGVTIQDMTVQGTIVDNITVQSRPRTLAGGTTGLNAAVIFRGDRTGLTGFGTVRDVRLRRMKIAKTNALPFLLDGVQGYATVMDVECYLTMDGSWVFCEYAVFDNIRSDKSADNGFSVSRGNKHVIGGSVLVDRCAYYGLWVSGWIVDGNINDAGPTNFTIDTINVTNAGMGGLKLDDAPSNGRIGNVFVNGVTRGSADEPTEAGGIGILIGGNPSQPNRNTVTAYASLISINSATLIGCARGGVLISGGAKDINLGSIDIYDAGTQYRSDGTTVITSGQRDTNFGVAVLQTYETSVSNVWVRNLRVVDRRGTPYTNYPVDLAGALTSGYGSLSALNCRQVVSSDSIAETYGGAKTYRQRIISAAPSCTVAAGAQAATAAAASSGANDMAGTVNSTAAASPSAGTLVTVSFGGTYTTIPRVVITPMNQASAQCQPYISARGLTSFTISANVAPGANASLQFDYHVLT